jgi:hypothetical protein
MKMKKNVSEIANMFGKSVHNTAAHQLTNTHQQELMQKNDLKQHSCGI